MPEKYGVRITPRALKDLEAIFRYIQADSPQGARKMIRSLLDAIDGLELLPKRFNVPRTGYVRGGDRSDRCPCHPTSSGIGLTSAA